MNVQEWLSRLLSRPAAEPLDWESYRVTMNEATWKAIWRHVDETQAYDDGLEAALRLLRATAYHRERLLPRCYESSQVLLYRTVLLMLDKAQRWETYLAAWDVIRSQTSLCLPVRGNALTPDDPHLAQFVRREDGGFGVSPPRYGELQPKTLAVHFLHTLQRRKSVIERKLAHERAGRLHAERAPATPHAVSGEEIRSRLVPSAESGR